MKFSPGDRVRLRDNGAWRGKSHGWLCTVLKDCGAALAVMCGRQEFIEPKSLICEVVKCAEQQEEPSCETPTTKRVRFNFTECHTSDGALPTVQCKSISSGGVRPRGAVLPWMADSSKHKRCRGNGCTECDPSGSFRNSAEAPTRHEAPPEPLATIGAIVHTEESERKHRGHCTHGRQAAWCRDCPWWVSTALCREHRKDKRSCRLCDQKAPQAPRDRSNRTRKLCEHFGRDGQNKRKDSCHLCSPHLFCDKHSKDPEKPRRKRQCRTCRSEAAPSGRVGAPSTLITDSVLRVNYS